MKITQSSDIVTCIQRIAQSTQQDKPKSSYDSTTEETSEEMDGDIVGLAKRVMAAIQKDDNSAEGQSHQDGGADVGQQPAGDKQR